MNIKGQINGVEIDIRKPDPEKLVKDGVWYEIIAYRCPEVKETSYSSAYGKIQTWFARPMFEIGYWILHPIPRPTPEWLKATGYTASEMPEEYKVGDVIFSDHFATSSVIEKSKTHRRRYLLTSKLFEPEKKTPKPPAQPEPSAPDDISSLSLEAAQCLDDCLMRIYPEEFSLEHRGAAGKRFCKGGGTIARIANIADRLRKASVVKDAPVPAPGESWNVGEIDLYLEQYLRQTLPTISTEARDNLNNLQYGIAATTERNKKEQK